VTKVGGAVAVNPFLATSYDGPAGLRTTQVDVPAPGPGQVTVAVRAAAVNPFDLSGRSALVTGYARPGSGFAREH